MDNVGRKGSPGKGPGRPGSPDIGCLVILVAFALAAGFLAASCGKPPPRDCRTFGCEPGFTCEKVGDVYKCVPVEPPDPPMTMLLRNDGSGQLVDLEGNPIDFLGVIPCCRPLEAAEVRRPMILVVNGEQKHTGWPVALHEDWRAFAEEHTGSKANFYHARLGPWFGNEAAEPDWTEYGGGYLLAPDGRADLTRFNPVFWDRVYELVHAAGMEGSYVEIDLNDRWWAKQRERPNPMRPEWNIQGYEWSLQVGRQPIQPGSVIDLWLEQVVRVLGPLSNVIWQDGNEVGLGPYNPEWTFTMRDRIRHHEKVVGGDVVHLFGTNSKNAEAEAGRVDYIEHHQKEPIPAPIHNKPSMVNEYNPRPAMTPGQLHDFFCRAQRAGTYGWYWRHSQTMPQLKATLALLGAGCEPDRDCPFNTPTAAWMIANGYDCSCTPKKEGRKNFGATCTCSNWPKVNGEPYYCQPGLWPEACAAQRRGGPVAPDGHPKRTACEKQFLQLDCPLFTYQSATHMSFDPFYMLQTDGSPCRPGTECVNRNHPRNVQVCGQMTGLEPDYEDHPSWKRDAGGHIYEGEVSIAMWAGNGKVCAEAKDGVAKKCVRYTEP